MSQHKSPASTPEYQELNRKLAACNKKLASERETIVALREAAQNPAPKPLSRSSLEAYAGIILGIILAVLNMSWYFRIILFLVLAVLSADFAYNFPIIYKLPKLAKVALCTAVVVCIVWTGWLNVQAAYMLANIPPINRYMLSYGTLDEHLSITTSPFQFHGIQGGKVIAAGYLLNKYSSGNYLVAVNYHLEGSEDFKRIKGISKSGAFDIENWSVEMPIPWNDKYISELKSGKFGAYYVLLLVPKGIKIDSFDSVQEALDRGAQILDTGGRPSGI